MPNPTFLPVISDAGPSTSLDLPVDEKLAALRQTLREMGSVAIGFSGGADSALLTRIAFDELGGSAVAVIALSESYPKRERDEAVALAHAMGVTAITVETTELADENYASNPTNRCYYCKQELFVHLEQVARERGLRWVAYGANHDDLGDYRPGQLAAKERGARAPLLEVGLTKPEIRHISRQMGLPTWDKPAMACLSSRFPYGTRITAELLARLDSAEDFLRHDLGFRQVRVRHHDAIARLEIGSDEMPRMLDEELRRQISDRLKDLGYTYVAVELTGYRSGSLNAPVLVPSTSPSSHDGTTRLAAADGFVPRADSTAKSSAFPSRCGKGDPLAGDGEPAPAIYRKASDDGDLSGDEPSGL